MQYRPTWWRLSPSRVPATACSETGDYERTIKGHTNAVLDVAFSPNGEVFGALGPMTPALAPAAGPHTHARR